MRLGQIFLGDSFDGYDLVGFLKCREKNDKHDELVSNKCKHMQINNYYCQVKAACHVIDDVLRFPKSIKYFDECLEFFLVTKDQRGVGINLRLVRAFLTDDEPSFN